MSTPELSEENCRTIIDGVKAKTAGRSIAALAAERDAVLLPLLEIVTKRG